MSNLFLVYQKKLCEFRLNDDCTMHTECFCWNYDRMNIHSEPKSDKFLIMGVWNEKDKKHKTITNENKKIAIKIINN